MRNWGVFLIIPSRSHFSLSVDLRYGERFLMMLSSPLVAQLIQDIISRLTHYLLSLLLVT